MTRREFNLCMAYMQVEPPEHGAEIRTASIMAQITNMSGRVLPDKKMVSASDFISKPETPQTPQTPEQQKDILRGFERKANGS